MATKDATLNNFKAFYKKIQPYLSGGAPAYADALTVNEFVLNSTDWESTTDLGYTYKYFIETDAYRDDSIPTWHILSADGSESVATKQEITEGQKIVSCVVNSTGVTLYAVALPNCNLTLFLKGGATAAVSSKMEIFVEAATGSVVQARKDTIVCEGTETATPGTYSISVPEFGDWYISADHGNDHGAILFSFNNAGSISWVDSILNIVADAGAAVAIYVGTICLSSFISDGTMTSFHVYLTGEFKVTSVLAGVSQEKFVHVFNTGETVYVNVEKFPTATYTELQYIKSQGAQYINTGLIPTSAIDITMQFKAYKGNDQSTLFGSRNNSSGLASIYGFYSDFRSVPNNWGMEISDLAMYTGDFSSYYSQLCNLKIHFTDCSIYDADYNLLDNMRSTVPSVFSPTQPLFLFNLNSGGSPYNDRTYSVMDLYHFYATNGTYAVDLIPAKRKSDNVLGLYDMVNKQFLTNLGSGSFIAGPEV